MEYRIRTEKECSSTEMRLQVVCHERPIELLYRPRPRHGLLGPSLGKIHEM